PGGRSASKFALASPGCRRLDQKLSDPPSVPLTILIAFLSPADCISTLAVMTTTQTPRPPIHSVLMTASTPPPRLGGVGKFMGDWNYALVYDFGGSSDGFASTASFGASPPNGRAIAFDSAAVA